MIRDLGSAIGQPRRWRDALPHRPGLRRRQVRAGVSPPQPEEPPLPAVRPSGRTLPDWDAIARDYAASTLAVPDLCTRHAVSASALYRRAKTDGWLMRRESGRRAPRRCSRPITMNKRLLAALDLKMTQFESRMLDAASAASVASPTAADSERDARTLGTLVRLFEKLTGFGEKTAASTRAAPQAGLETAAPAGKDAHDADRLRQELAQRLEKLRAGLGG